MKPPAPLLLIDVDEVISLFGFDQTGPPEGRLLVVDGLGHPLSARHAGELPARLAVAPRHLRAGLDGPPGA